MYLKELIRRIIISQAFQTLIDFFKKVKIYGRKLILLVFLKNIFLKYTYFILYFLLYFSIKIS